MLLKMLVPDKQKGVLHHVEPRPSEKGRAAFVIEGTTNHPLFEGYSLRSSIHEYGGAPAAAFNEYIVFTDAADKRVFLVKDEVVKPLTLASKIHRYGDFAIHPSLEYVVCIQESHFEDGSVVNKLVCISLTSESDVEPIVLAFGKDFYTAPRFSASGNNLAWIEWNLPAMPWTQSSLHLAEFNVESGLLLSPRAIASGSFSVSQPRWSPKTNELYFASDESGYYNLYRYNISTTTTTPLLKSPHIGDFSFPDWVLGQQTYDFLPNGNVIAGHANKDGTSSISLLNPESQEQSTLVSGQSVIALTTIKERVFIVAGTPVTPIALSQVVLNDSFDKVVTVKEIRSTTEGLKGLDPEKWISVAESIEFPTDNGLTAFGY
ncbi:UNVERIFIED_CONTAM: Dipeptidyl aminopeptidase [Siphonaria sp. JEL0065]|nr:Dipeptidyl aminopeptidase [Siphonaria sp. JEL0065]